MVELLTVVLRHAQMCPRHLVMAEPKGEAPLKVSQLPRQQFEAHALLAGVTAIQKMFSDLLGLLVSLHKQDRDRKQLRLLRQPNDTLIELVERQGTDGRGLHPVQQLLDPDRARREKGTTHLDCLASVRGV